MSGAIEARSRVLELAMEHIMRLTLEHLQLRVELESERKQVEVNNQEALFRVGQVGELLEEIRELNTKIENVEIGSECKAALIDNLKQRLRDAGL